MSFRARVVTRQSNVVPFAWSDTTVENFKQTALDALLMGLQARPVARLCGFGWLASWGRLSYEIYLSHMFVVYAVVRVYRATGGDVRWGFVWYALALPICWLLGAGVARWVSLPCERALRARMLKTTLRRVPAGVPASAESQPQLGRRGRKLPEGG